MQFLLKNTKRLSNAFYGIWVALVRDTNFRLHVLGGIFVLLPLCYYFWPLSEVEVLFLGLGWTLLVVTELQNSALEQALNHLHPKQHKTIGLSKDMAAGAVLFAAAFLIGVVVVIAFS